MDLSINEWVQVMKDYQSIAKIGKDFLFYLDHPKGSFMHPLAGTNHSGLLGGENPEILDQIREVVGRVKSPL